MRKGIFFAVATMLAITSCSSDDTDQAKPLIVATTSILGDITSSIVGESATVETLMPPGVDPHDFQLSSSQAARMANAQLIVSNGLGLEEGIEDVLAALAIDGVRVFEAAELVDPIPFGEYLLDVHEDHGEHEDGSHDDHDGHDHGSLDPHFWHDPLRVATAAELIGDELAEVLGDPSLSERARGYADQLRALDTEIATIFDVIPVERRILVTNHDSLGYLANRYGFDVLGVVIPGGSTLAEPSSSELAQLTAAIDESEAPAIFVETIASSALAEAVTDELGRPIQIVSLFTDSLGDPGSNANTYIGMMRSNASLIADALAP